MFKKFFSLKSIFIASSTFIGYGAYEMRNFLIYAEQDRYRVNKEDELLKRIEKLTKNELDIKLYQYQVCPFCCKVRTFFKYSQIPFSIIEVDPIMKRELFFSSYKKVPVVIINGDIQLNDSSYIITILNQIYNYKEKTKDEIESEIKWREWVDNKFIHTIPPNIYRTNEEALEAFEYISNQNGFRWDQKLVIKYMGAPIMQIVAKKLKKKHNIDNERKAIFECIDEWMNEIKDKKFHGGNEPDLADLAVYGGLLSIEGLKTFNETFEHNKNVGVWYDRVKQELNKR